MPQPIQRNPAGLLTLLDSKTLGMGPGILLDEVRGTVELRDLYECRRRLSRNASILGATINASAGAFIDAVGPLADEIWHLRGITYRSDLGALPAAGFLQFTLGVRDLQGATNSLLQLGPTSPLFAGATDAPAYGVLFDQFLVPGHMCGMYVNRAVTAEDSFITATFDLYKPV